MIKDRAMERIDITVKDGEMTKTKENSYWREVVVLGGEQGVPERLPIRQGKYVIEVGYVHFKWELRDANRWLPSKDEGPRWQWEIDHWGLINVVGRIIKKDGTPGEREGTTSFGRDDYPGWLQAIVDATNPAGKENPFEIGTDA